MILHNLFLNQTFSHWHQNSLYNCAYTKIESHKNRSSQNFLNLMFIFCLLIRSCWWFFDSFACLHSSSSPVLIFILLYTQPSMFISIIVHKKHVFHNENILSYVFNSLFVWLFSSFLLCWFFFKLYEFLSSF